MPARYGRILDAAQHTSVTREGQSRVCLEIEARSSSAKVVGIGFDAEEECRVVACFYHHVNWWVQNFIHSDKNADEIESTEDDNFFL